VWVGYPDKLVPMTHEYHGHPVAGGTFPAKIWNTFMTKALPYLKQPPEPFPPPPSLYASPVTVTFRHGELERDNGVCNDTTQIAFFGGEEPKRVADCKPNEVEVPDVRGDTLVAAKARLAGQPLSAAIVYKPAEAGERLGIVVGQIPAGGVLSAWDKVTLVLPKPLHGVVPKLVGLQIERARS